LQLVIFADCFSSKSIHYMADILVINGPNLNLLGEREPEYYGDAGLEAINSGLEKLAAESGRSIDFFQSNAEHELVDRVQKAMQEGTRFVLINPAAFTHTSVALRDALAASRIPFIEIHLSNIYARESFRHQSYFSDIAVGVVSGLGAQGYELALRAALQRLS
jgi:3-dehydroquinate dehydratase-2